MGSSAMSKEKLNDGNCKSRSMSERWKKRELFLLIAYAFVFYVIIIRRSLQLSNDYYKRLYGLRPGWLTPHPLNDVSDAQWRNFRGNIPVLTIVFGIFTLLAKLMRSFFSLKVRGMSTVWLLFSLIYLSYLHGACIVFILSIATVNFLLVKIFARKKYFMLLVWSYNLFFLLCNRVYEGYPFSTFGKRLAFLDNYRGNFRWHICFNFVVLRMISFGLDYHGLNQDSRIDQEKHCQRCHICKSGKPCYQILQERSLQSDKYRYTTYLCYLLYAPLYIAGPIVGFNAFSHQLDVPQSSNLNRNVICYGFRWVLSLLVMEIMTHLFYYNAFAISGLWKHLSPMDVFIIGYGVLNFMWLKFLLIWRYFRFWLLINGIEVPENMPKCINNCHSLEGFWKNWHASFNKWLVSAGTCTFLLGGSQNQLLNVWVIFTFVAIWHDLEWYSLLLYTFHGDYGYDYQAESGFGEYLFRELSAVAGAVTITCLMVANLVGFVIGPGGINGLLSSFIHKEGLAVLGGLLLSFYVGTKLMFHIAEAKQRSS